MRDNDCFCLTLLTSDVVLRTEELPPVAGRPGVAQGGYGERGNLELVVPDPEDGFWVLWWNADLVDARSGARPGCWSGGLHVPTGLRHTSAAITQLRRGPKFLDAVLAGPAGLHRTTWSPDGGFAPASLVAAGPVVSSCAVVEPPLGHALHVLVSTADDVRHLQAPADRYPELAWSSSALPAAPGAAVALAPANAERLLAVAAEPDAVVVLRWTPDGGWVREEELPATRGWREVAVVGSLVLGLDESGYLCAAATEDGHASAPDVVADSFTAAASTVDGGRIEVVTRRGTTLQHLWTDAAGSWCPAADVRSEVWADPALPTVHRRL
jgi:hypothetical protein